MAAGHRELVGAWFSDPAISLAWCGVVLTAAEVAQRLHGAEFDATHGSFIAASDEEPVGSLPSPDNQAVIAALRNAGFTQRDPNWSLLERAAPSMGGGDQVGP